MKPVIYCYDEMYVDVLNICCVVSGYQSYSYCFKPTGARTHDLPTSSLHGTR